MTEKDTITLKHLAQKLDLASSTVSRALNGMGGVGEAKAREIRLLAKELGYQPKPLRRKLADAIGLLIVTDDKSRPDDAYHYEFVYALNRACKDLNWHVHIELIHRDDEAQLPAIITQHRVDGVLITGYPTETFCQRLIDAQMPTVVLDDLSKRVTCACVCPDIAKQTAAIVRMLMEVGHEHFAYVTAPTDYPTVLQRLEGYLGALQEAGYSADKGSVIKVPHSAIHSGQIATRQLMQNPIKPTAIFYATDRLALGGMIELARLGLSVPTDISVISHDNTSLAQETDPPLTSVDLNIHQSIEAAIDLLQSQIDANTVLMDRQVNIPVQTVWRASSGPAARG